MTMYGYDFLKNQGFKLLTEGIEWLRYRYLLRQSVPDTGSCNRERPVTDCWTSDRWHHQTTGATYQSAMSVGRADRQQERDWKESSYGTPTWSMSSLCMKYLLNKQWLEVDRWNTMEEHTQTIEWM